MPAVLVSRISRRRKVQFLPQLLIASSANYPSLRPPRERLEYPSHLLMLRYVEY